MRGQSAPSPTRWARAPLNLVSDRALISGTLLVLAVSLVCAGFGFTARASVDDAVDFAELLEPSHMPAADWFVEPDSLKPPIESGVVHEPENRESMPMAPLPPAVVVGAMGIALAGWVARRFRRGRA